MVVDETIWKSKTWWTALFFIIFTSIFVIFYLMFDLDSIILNFCESLKDIIGNEIVKDSITQNIGSLLGSIITGFFALLGLLATMYVFYAKILRGDEEKIRKWYTELYDSIGDSKKIESLKNFDNKEIKKLKIEIDNPKDLTIDKICNIFNKLINDKDKKITNFHLKIGHENIENMIRIIDKRGDLRGKKFNRTIIFVLTSAIGGIWLLLMLNKMGVLFLLIFATYLGWILISLLSILKYLIKISNI